ncbi:MAG TPA: ABC transporter permease [Phycisphaerae bacterium]|nr:ABC transporter permease [Phycisphaerae bacterium]
MNHGKAQLEKRIVAGRGFGPEIVSEMWEYRELFWALAKRSVLVRYKQTVAGVLWALLRPLVTMVVMTVLFGGLMKMPSGGVPYPLLTFAGILPWMLFAQSLGGATNSLVAEGALIKKVYFPRLIVPLSACMTALIDFLIAGVVFAVMMALYGYAPTWRVAVAPLFVLMALLTALGPGLLLSPLNARYRDVQHLTPFIIQMGMFLSPVGYSSEAVVPDRWRLLYSLNPMTPVIEGFRWSVLGTGSLRMTSLLYASAFVLVFLLSGLWFFRRQESVLADVI